MASEPAASDAIVRLEGVQKFFGAVQALRDITLTIGRNEIVGLIGDNGAGKSTLIKVITGVLAAHVGQDLRPRPRDSQSEYSVRMAHELSIETVYQDKSLAEKQPLWRNFFVGRQITNRFGFINIKKEKEVAAADPDRRHRLSWHGYNRQFNRRQAQRRRAARNRDRPRDAL